MTVKIGGMRPGGLTLLTVIVAVLPLLLPNPYFYDVVILCAINAIVCVGLNLLIGYAGQISLGHAGFLGLGAYGSAILSGSFHWPAPLALLGATLLVGVLAFLVGRPILKLKGHSLAIATLGLGLIISIVIVNEDQLTGGPDGLNVTPFSTFGLTIQGEVAWYWVIGALLILTIGLARNVVDSPLGRALRAVHGSEVAAQSLGVDVARFKLTVFVLSAVLAALAGAVAAHYSGFITPNKVGFVHSVELVTMVMLGGVASTFGPVIGAVILTALPQMLTLFEDYETLAFGAVLMCTMIFMPRGLVPTLTAWLEARRR